MTRLVSDFQVTVQLSHLINAFHSLKSSVSNTPGRIQREHVIELDLQTTEVTWLALHLFWLADFQHAKPSLDTVSNFLVSFIILMICFQASDCVGPK